MNRAALIGGGILLLLATLALSSFVAAAPPTPSAPPLSAPSPTAQAETDDNDAEFAVSAAAPVNPGAMSSRILVINPDTSGTATVSVRIVDGQGNTVATLPTFSVVSNGAIARALPASVASPFQGSAVVSSDKNVQAYVTTSNLSNAARDLYSSAGVSASALTLPLVRHLANDTQNSIIAVQNTSGAAANVTVQFYDQGGALIKTVASTGTVAPAASAYFNTNTIFGATQFTGSARVTMDGGAVPVASEQTRFVKDTAAFRALTSVEQGQVLYVNFVERRMSSTGQPLNWNELYVRNNGGGPAQVTFEYFKTTGGPSLYSTKVSVPQDGMTKVVTKDPALSKLGPNFKGWVKISSDGQPLAAYSLENWNGGARLFGMEGLPDASVTNKYLCGDVWKSSSQSSRLSILNTGTTTTTVTFKMYGSVSGKLLDTKTQSVGPGKVGTKAVNGSTFPGLPATYEGISIVSATQPIVVSVYTPFQGTTTGGITSYVCGSLP